MVIHHRFHQSESSDVADGLDVKSHEKGVTFPEQLSLYLDAPENTRFNYKYSFLGLITTDSHSIGLGIELQYPHSK